MVQKITHIVAAIEPDSGIIAIHVMIDNHVLESYHGIYDYQKPNQIFEVCKKFCDKNGFDISQVELHLNPVR